MVLRGLGRLLLFAVLLGAGACGSGSKPPPRPTMVLAGLVGDPPTAVEVEVENLPPTQRIERVFLVDRRGGEIEATEFERSTPESSRGPSVLPQVSVGVGSSVRSSVGIGVPLGVSEEPEARSSVTVQIPLPNPEAYLATPEDWTVVVKGRDRRGLPVTYRVPAPRRPGTTYETPATRASQPLKP